MPPVMKALKSVPNTEKATMVNREPKYSCGQVKMSGEETRGCSSSITFAGTGMIQTLNEQTARRAAAAILNNLVDRPAQSIGDGLALSVCNGATNRV